MHAARLSLVAALALFVASPGCKKKDEPAAAPPTPAPSDAAVAAPEPAQTDPTDLYLACIAAFNARNEAELARCYADDAPVQLADEGAPMIGGAAIVASNVALWTAMPDTRQLPQVTIVAGQRVGALLYSTGTHTGPLVTPAGELAPTQATIGSVGIEIVDVAPGGRIARATQVADTGLILRQLQQLPSTRPPVVEGEAKPRVLRSQSTPAEKATVEALRTALAAFSTGDLDGAAKVLDDDSVLSATALVDDPVGAAAIRAQLTALRRAFPDLTVELGDVLAADGQLIATLKVSGTYGKSKKPLALTAGLAATITDGVIDHAWLVTNGLAAATQLGLK